MKSKYDHLLSDPDVKRWFQNLEAKSVITATVYLRSLGLYCELNHTTPKEILKVAATKNFRDGFTDFVRGLERNGKAGSYIARFKKVLHSWLAYNGVSVRLKVNIAREYETPTLVDETVPSKEELDKIIRMATPRARVSIALMAFSGLRPESLGDYSGTDALAVGDLPESKVGNERLEFSKTPSMIVVRKNLSKTKHQYFTFIPDQGITYLNEYVQERIKQGETFDRKSPILGFDARGGKKNKHLRTNLVTRDIKEAMLRAGFKWRPYVLRAYFDTNMIIAESKGKISHPYLQFLVGHRGDMEARYSTNKMRLPPDMIEDIREAYKRSQTYLQTIKPEANEGQVRETFRRQLLLVAGFKQKEIDEDNLLELSDEEFQAKVRERLLGATQNNIRQKVVPVDEIETYLTKGWEYAATLPNGRTILRLPS